MPNKLSTKNISPTKKRIRPTMYNALFTFGSKFVLLPMTSIITPIIISATDAPSAIISLYAIN